MNAAGLIKVLMIVGFFVNGNSVGQFTTEATMRECEAARAYAVEFNARTAFFWQDERMIAVGCLAHPFDREA